MPENFAVTKTFTTFALEHWQYSLSGGAGAILVE